MAMLEGVDVSYAQGNYKPGAEDFVIVNASRANVGLAVGSEYRNQVANARAAGKHVGHYFFNGNVDPADCADFFVDNLTYAAGDSLWLDVESEASTNTAAWNPSQALAFLSRVKARVGVMPGVYLNKSLMDGSDWSAVVKAGAPLWIAYYNPSPPPIKWWPDWTVWQYTSTPIDRNKAQATLTAAASGDNPLEEDEMDKLNVIRNYDGSIGIVDDAGLLTPLIDLGEWNSYQRLGIVQTYKDANGNDVNWLQQADGTVWNALAKVTARVNAQRAGDPKALAQATAALVVPAVLAGVQANGGASLTQAQVEAAAEAAIKDVFADAAS